MGVGEACLWLTDAHKLLSVHLLLPLLERAITGYELLPANGAFLHITTGNVELAFQNSTVMAGYSVCVPVLTFISVSNARNRLTIKRV